MPQSLDRDLSCVLAEAVFDALGLGLLGGGLVIHTGGGPVYLRRVVSCHRWRVVRGVALLEHWLQFALLDFGD